MITWSDIEKDALCEFLNMGMGTAAASLSTMLGPEILLSVPEIDFVTQDELERWFRDEIGDDIVGVQQAFNGKAAGHIALLFNRETSCNLVHDLMSGDIPLEDLPDIHNDAITEIGNIVLNACMAAIADSLNLEIPTELPRLTNNISIDINTGEAAPDDEVFGMLGQIKFDLKDRGITGYVVLHMSTPSALRMKQEIQKMLSIYAATG